MKKTYQSTKTEILGIGMANVMIPTTYPSDPHPAPKGHFVPGPGASYDPQANIL